MLTAGCIGMGGEQVDPASTEQPDAQDETLDELFENATTDPDRNTTVDDWFAVDAESGPDAPLTAFQWTVPEGAVLDIEFFDEQHDTVVLEVVPHLPDDASLTEWAMLAFHEGDDGQELRSALASVTVEQRSSIAVLEEEDTQEAELESSYLFLGVDEVDAGDTVTFVTTARTEQPADLGVAFRPLPVIPASLTDPAEDPGELRAQEATSPIELTARANATGFQPAFYFEGNVNGAFGFEAWTEHVDVERGAPADTRPMASVRDLTLSATFESASGWGLGSAYHFGSSGAETWSTSADVHGTTLEQNRHIVQAGAVPGGFATNLLTGFPVYFVIGDGEGGTDVQVDIEGAHVNEQEFLGVFQVDIGASLTELTGEAGATEAETFDGLADDRTRLTYEDGTARILGVDGPALVLQGLPEDPR